MWSRLDAESSMMVGVTDSPDEMQELATEGSGQYPRENVDKVTNITVDEGVIHEESENLLSAVLERPNMLLAYDRVMRNKGAAGVDGMKVES